LSENRTLVAYVAGEHSSKELFEQLVLLLFGTSTVSNIFAEKSENFSHLKSLRSETLDSLLETVIEPGWKDDNHGDMVALVGQLHHVGLQLLTGVVIEAALLLHELHQPDLKGEKFDNFIKQNDFLAYICSLHETSEP
jgi:hypothetical protein